MHGLSSESLQSCFTVGVVPDTGLLFGLLLVFAIAGGYTAHALRIPRVVGYLLAGVGLKMALPAMLGIDPHGEQGVELAAAEQPLQAIKDLALGLILFSIGRVFEAQHVRAVGRNVLRISLAGAAVTGALVFCGMMAAGWIFGAPISGGTLVAFSLLLGAAATATAPAATLFTLQEYEAKGPVTDTVLSVTGFADVLCIVGFQLCLLVLIWTGLIGTDPGGTGNVWLGALTGTVGSVALGVALGFLIGVVHTKLQVAESLLVLVSVLIVLSAGERWLMDHTGVSYNALLTSLSLGAVFFNIAVDPGRMDSAIRMVGPPLFVGFFVLAGYQLHVEDLWSLGGIGVTYMVCRATGKLVGSWLGVRWAGAEAGVQPHIGTGLLCQAAIVIGLADLVKVYWGESWPGQSFVTTILGSAVVFEICGPVLFKWFVVRCGEVKAVTLLRRESLSEGGPSAMSLTAEALLRAIGLRRTPRQTKDEPLLVRHLMRTSVKTIPASASFDDVLHMVEQSRFVHFPVVDDEDRLVGVIHFVDLRQMIYDPIMSSLVTAADLANPVIEAVPVDMPLEEVLKIFRDSDLSSLPVIADTESRKVVGIIEQRDLLRVLRKP